MPYFTHDAACPHAAAADARAIFCLPVYCFIDAAATAAGYELVAFALRPVWSALGSRCGGGVITAASPPMQRACPANLPTTFEAPAGNIKYGPFKMGTYARDLFCAAVFHAQERYANVRCRLRRASW